MDLKVKETLEYIPRKPDKKRRWLVIGDRWSVIGDRWSVIGDHFTKFICTMTILSYTAMYGIYFVYSY